MELFQMLSGIDYRMIQGTDRINAGKVTNDTRELYPGDVYVCVDGYRTDGHRFAKEAANRGAAAIVTEKPIERPAGAAVVRTFDTRLAMARMAAAYYSYPAGALKTIGVTGTKGKTTTTWIIREVLRSAGYRPGLIGTIETDTGRRVISSSHTTPESCQIQKYLAEMRDAGCDTAVMEVSSQGLKLKRTEGIYFDIGVFTNLGEDHIGYGEHRSPAEYRHFKSLLFRQCKTGVGNIDDGQYEDIFAKAACRKVTFGMGRLHPADYTPADIRGWKIPLPGEFNIYNVLAATAVLRELGLKPGEIRKGVAHIWVPGRMEEMQIPDKGKVYLDYAHNAMSLENALRALRSGTKGRLIAVFGCGGGRAKERRYQMGATAGALADYTILTSDNPRYEKPEDILKDIETGIKRTDGRYEIISDRRTAIREAVMGSRPEDTVLVAGKGHETYQEIKGVKYPFNDREILKELSEEITCTQISLSTLPMKK